MGPRAFLSQFDYGTPFSMRGSPELFRDHVGTVDRVPADFSRCKRLGKSIVIGAKSGHLIFRSVRGGPKRDHAKRMKTLFLVT
jgi:hypothetical protein